MRPRNGMDLGRWKPFQINEYLARATATSSASEMSNKIQIKINSNQNILAVHTEDEETTRALTRVHQLTLGGKSYPSYTYLVAPDNSIKGVIHDVKPGFITEELHDFIRVGNRPQIITARMLGQSSSALITFEGRKLSSYVIYSASRQRVLPYRPPRQICARCLREGHRGNVCPTQSIRVCTQCATQNPTPDHACTPKCLLCDGQHPTGDKMCQRCYNERQSIQDNTTKSTTSSKSRSRSRARSRARQPPSREGREKSQGRSQTPQQQGRTPRHRRSQTPRRQNRSKTKYRSKSRDQSHTRAQHTCSILNLKCEVQELNRTDVVTSTTREIPSSAPPPTCGAFVLTERSLRDSGTEENGAARRQKGMTHVSRDARSAEGKGRISPSRG
ncbi:hypothetical protein HPB47_025045 [Ixodes persulcatus]|uniref:Uncharacterized protein n=1 Tax=Ixodes persulcatus TaxID=34615 RepID=A0AC60Q2K3_IXOPE|nr:hypothetical protein HPB47_025045 [Ixodes persulcatus]